MENAGSRLYAVQFHPEVVHTPFGTQLLKNFVLDICGCAGSWKMSSYVETTVQIPLWQRPCWRERSESSSPAYS